MTTLPPERWAEEIAAALRQRYGRSTSALEPIDLGWLNVKWKAVTDDGPLFVKAYHPDRYKLHERPDRRSELANTLRLQRELREAGVACPAVHPYEGQWLQETSSGLLFAVHDWTDGAPVRAGDMSETQLFELGVATGRMHARLRAEPPSSRQAWTPNREAYLTAWESHRENAATAGDDTVLDWLERSGAVVRALDFRTFDDAPTGWLHWDLWVDNLLFRGERLAGVVDFDRMAYAYPEIDVARAVLSGALSDGELRTEAVKAFMEGYRERSETPRGMLARAMRMIYLIESVWWYRTEIRVQSQLRTLLGRFIEEMQWIERHWDALTDMLDEA